MSTSVEALAAEAIRLSAEDRSRLAELLLASLPEDTDADAAWDEEIRRRVAQVSEGTARIVTADEVHAAARRIYQK